MPTRRTPVPPLTLESLHRRLELLERQPRLNAREIAVVREQLQILHEQTPLSTAEISALRALARSEVARLAARTRWRLRWQHWTTRQRLGFGVGLVVAVITIANQVVSLVQGLGVVRPLP